MADRSRNISREDRAREAKSSFHKKEKPRGIGNVSPVYRVATGVFALTSFAAVLGCFLIYGYFHLKEAARQEQEAVIEAAAMGSGKTAYSQEDVDALLEEAVSSAVTSTENDFLATLKSRMESGDGTVAVLRDFYPDDIVLLDSGQYHFIPISDTLAQNDYDINHVVLNEDHTISYVEEEETISRKGIDVSKYQGEINWEQVAGDGVEYAVIRLGIRGYSEGTLVLDEKYEANIQGAAANGIDVGAYFFTQATSEAEALEEAQFVIENLAPYHVNFPVVLDVEAVGSGNARTKDLTVEERTQYAITFCEAVKAAGYTPMIYGNLKTFMLMLDMERLEDYQKWFAAYDTSKIYFPYAFSIWQYTDKGSVAGIDGDVDLNITFGQW